MSTDIIQQEILLLTGTTFSKRQLSKSDTGDDSNYLSESAKLEEACWTGLIDDLLPEIITNKELGISQFRDSKFSLQIELAEYPSEEKPYSINPPYFLRTIGNN